MTLLKILQYPNTRLKQRAKKVETIDSNIQRLIADMFETHYATENCAALAASQLDIPVPYRITVIDFSPQRNQPLCLINPEIVHAEGEQTEAEGCMSVGGETFEEVTRAAKIRVRALDRFGKPMEFEAEGFMAKCIQHEVDHLDGILFLDHLSSLRRQRIDKRLKKLKRTTTT